METIVNDRYKFLHQLGSGGFGETFLAEDTQTARKVVVKSLQPIHQQTTAEITERLFQKEASVLKDLGSQCTQVPTLYDYFTEDSKYYLVQEYIEGQNLADKGVITSPQCLKILSSLLDTLKYIHSKNIIHRDIKPENIIIRKSDRLPVLIDFGAVKETMGVMSIPSGSTVSSIVVGTRVFMPPEQSTGRTVFSSDLYSLALTLISALTGKLPTEIPANPITGELDWQKLVTDLDPILDQVLSKASKMDIPSRYPTAEEMLDALKSGSLSESITVTKSIQLTKTKKKVSKKPLVTTNPSEKIPIITTPITPNVTSTVSEISSPPITTTTITNPVSNATNSQPSAKSNNLMAIVLTSILVALGVSAGFWLLTQKNQAQQRLAEIEQIKKETELKLLKEQEKGEDTPPQITENRIQNKSEFRQNPHDFISNHYQLLSSRDYIKTWDNLSDNFRSNFDLSYLNYQNWWDSVSSININDVVTIFQNERDALVKVKLSYLLNDGRWIEDDKPFIYLKYDQNENKWLIDDKSSNNDTSAQITENRDIPKEITSVLVFDPPSNVRRSPNGKIVCTITDRIMIDIDTYQQNKWYKTSACGIWNGWIHESQFTSGSENENSIISEDEGIALIENLYYLLSNQEFEQANKLYSYQTQNKFEPRFFQQFSSVTVENLQVVSQNSSFINFIGDNIYIYPDGSTQKEQRSYTVRKIDGIPKITDSEFIEVTKFR